MSQIVALRHIALGVHFATQQALCNALGASGLHWVWAIDATSGPRSLFRAAKLACQPSRCQKKSTSAFRHAPLAYSLTLSLLVSWPTRIMTRRSASVVCGKSRVWVSNSASGSGGSERAS